MTRAVPFAALLRAAAELARDGEDGVTIAAHLRRLGATERQIRRALSGR